MGMDTSPKEIVPDAIARAVIDLAPHRHLRVTGLLPRPNSRPESRCGRPPVSGRGILACANPIVEKARDKDEPGTLPRQAVPRADAGALRKGRTRPTAPVRRPEARRSQAALRLPPRMGGRAEVL